MAAAEQSRKTGRDGSCVSVIYKLLLTCLLVCLDQSDEFYCLEKRESTFTHFTKKEKKKQKSAQTGDRTQDLRVISTTL